MLLKTIKGIYQLEYNFKNAFNLDDFISKYIEECFDMYQYIVGDISSGILRLKGFSSKPNAEVSLNKINKYLEFSCVVGCPYFILKRTTENEYNNLKQNEKNVNEDGIFVPRTIEKVNFDRDSLKLETTKKIKPHIEINMKKQLSMPINKVMKDVTEYIKQDKATTFSVKEKLQPKQENVTSYISSSPDFDPSKKNKPNRNQQNSKNKNSLNKQNNNFNMNPNNKNNEGSNKDRNNKNNNFKQKNKKFKSNNVRKEQKNG